MMIRTQVYLPEELHIELKLLAKEKGVNYSSLIREGVKVVISKKKKKRSDWAAWKGLVGVVKGGPKTDAVKVIEDYYNKDVV